MLVCLTGADLPLGRAVSCRLRSHGIEVEEVDNLVFEGGETTVQERLSGLSSADYIIHAAELGWEAAEKNPEKAQQMNVHACSVIVEYAEKWDAPILFISSFMVFDGSKKNPYISANSGAPLNVYGRTKLAAEAFFLKNFPKVILIRLGWLLDADSDSWLGSILQELLKGDNIFGYADVEISPTSVDDVARVIEAILKQLDCNIEVWGIYHYAGTEPVTYEIFLRAVHYQAMGQDVLESQIISKNYRVGDASVSLPMNSVLGCIKLRNTFGIKQLPWRRYMPSLIEKHLKAIAKGKV